MLSEGSDRRTCLAIKDGLYDLNSALERPSAEEPC